MKIVGSVAAYLVTSEVFFDVQVIADSYNGCIFTKIFYEEPIFFTD